MSVKLTSPVLGQGVGYIYTGSLEDWLLAQGYAKRDADTTPTSYSGPGVANAGATSVNLADDPREPENREAPYFPSTEDRHTTVANDGANLTLGSLAAPGFDFDQGGVDTEAPSDVVLEPAEGPAAGGTEVTITGNNLEGVTAVTFDAVAGTDLDVSQAGDGVIKVTTPAGTAGPADVLLDDGATDTTLAGGFTYTA